MRQAPKFLVAGLAAALGVCGGQLYCAPAHAQDDPTTSTTESASPPATRGPAGFLTSTLAIGADTNQPLNLEGDELIYDSAGRKVTARGNVVISYNNRVLRADEVVYDQAAGTLTAIGNVQLKEPNGTVTRGERLTLTDDFRDGFVEALSVRTSDNTRITARRAIRRDGSVNEFEDGKFTPCRTDGSTPPLWCIAASRVIHNQANGTISYEDVQFEVFGTPILYVPYFQHADPSVKRKSGFLQPEYDSSSTRGFSVTIPYYFALSESYDFTFNPRYMTEQGIMWQGTWRQRLAVGGITGSYEIKFAAIDQDADDLPDDTDNASDLNGLRGTIETRGAFSLSSWWRFGWDVTVESDDTFRRFYKFDSILITDRVNSAYLIGQSERNYFSVLGYQFGGLQLNETSTSESRVHPVIDWNYIVGQPVLGGELSWNVNALSLSRSGEAIDSGDLNSSHNRISADVTWRRKLMDSVGITYTPFANLRADAFIVDDVVNASTALSDSDTVVRGTASAGILAAYPWVARTANASHVIEPLGQVIFRTSSDDDEVDLPNEDARSVVFDTTNLFEIDKFSGYDRTEVGSRANVGIQYTFQLDSGGYGRLLAGQSFRIDGRNAFADTGTVVTSDGETEPGITQSNGLETDRSDYVVGVYLSPSRVFSLTGQARFDEGDLSLERADIFTRASYGPAFASATYAYISEELANANELSSTATDDDRIGSQQELVANVGLQLTTNWKVAVGMRYDIDRSFRLAESYSITYADECFVLSVSYTSTNLDEAESDIENDQTVMIRFDLKHLGQFQAKSSLSDFGLGTDS
ncbi:MAG: LPS-assembly protein LptD [Pseudomonadota bacterium]